MTRDSITRDGTLPLAMAWTDLGSIMLSEISQSEKDKSHVTSRICGIYRTTNQRMKHNSEIWRRDCAYQRGGLGVGSVGGRWTGWGQVTSGTVRRAQRSKLVPCSGKPPDSLRRCYLSLLKEEGGREGAWPEVRPAG